MSAAISCPWEASTPKVEVTTIFTNWVCGPNFVPKQEFFGSWSNFFGSVSVWANGLPPYPQISFSARFCPKVQLWRRLNREGFYTKVSMNPSFWLYFWFILTTYWLHFGYILPTCWLHSVTFWLHFGYILAAFLIFLSDPSPIIVYPCH